MEKDLLIHALMISDNHGNLFVDLIKNDKFKSALLSGFISALKLFGEETLGNIRNISVEGLDIDMLIVYKFNLFIMAIIDSNIPELNLREGCEETLKLFYQMYKERIPTWDGDVRTFSGFKDILNAQIQQYLKNLEEFVDISDQAKRILIQERDSLLNQVKVESNLKQKLTLQEKILEISEKLRDNKGIEQIQKDIKKTKEFIKDTEFKLKYFLEKAKDAILALKSYGQVVKLDTDYSQVYLNLFSFSSKLKTLIFHTGWKRYFNLASKIQNKDKISAREFSETISEIQNLSENIEEYL